MKHIKQFNDLIVESINKTRFKKMLREIDANDDFKYYIGYIRKDRRRKVYTWARNGIFKGFNDHVSALNYIDQIRIDGVPEENIDIFSAERYAEVRKAREIGV